MASSRVPFYSGETPRTTSSVLRRLYQVECEVDQLHYRLRQRPSLPGDNFGSRWRPNPVIATTDKHRVPCDSIDLIRQEVQNLPRQVQRVECLISRMYYQRDSFSVRSKPRAHEHDRNSMQAKKKVHWWDQIETAAEGKERNRRY